jgi:ketosteroid isomerase-like protein
MKKYFLTLIAILFLALTSCREKIDINKEIEAIVAVCEKETGAYYARDFQQQYECFIHDETTSVIYAEVFIDGWHDINAAYNQVYERDPAPSTNKFENENYKIKVYGDCAWAVYDQYLVDKDGTFYNQQREVRFLEKVDGEWKIVLLSVLAS